MAKACLKLYLTDVRSGTESLLAQMNNIEIVSPVVEVWGSAFRFMRCSLIVNCWRLNTALISKISLLYFDNAPILFSIFSRDHGLIVYCLLRIASKFEDPRHVWFISALSILHYVDEVIAVSDSIERAHCWATKHRLPTNHWYIAFDTKWGPTWFSNDVWLAVLTLHALCDGSSVWCIVV